MIQTQLRHDDSVLDLGSLDAAGWLSPCHIAAVADVLTATRGWCVDEHMDYHGCVMMVATHALSDRTWSFSDTGSNAAPFRVELFRVREDAMVPCGTFASAEDAAHAVLWDASSG